jgi:hypothetical protein
MWQAIAATGLVVSLMAQGGLIFLGKEVENFVYLYPVWLAVFVLATLWRILGPEPDPNEHAHHHHH